ncbi:MAG: cytochrome c [Deltaproteobacteria bacterium]|nr:MAG: cytochrome c [Deltaproteobacteria bacterium]
MSRGRLLTASLVLLLAPSSRSAEVDASGVRRLLAVLGGVVQEYGEAFTDDGALSRPIELEEAGLLLADARNQAERLGQTPPDLERQLAALGKAIEDRAPAAAIAAQVRAIRVALEDSTGIGEDIFPPARPSPGRGEAIFRENCTRCHGERGAGDGPDVATLERKPRDFSDPAFMQQETPADFFRVISLGRRQAAMPAWEDVLSVQDRWDVVSYLWSLPADVRQTLAEVERQVDAALTAHLLGERNAGELATDAYLTFEPLEARLALDDSSAVRGVEGAFLRFRTALGQPATEREVDEAARAVRSALRTAESSASAAAPRPISHLGAGWIWGAVLAGTALLLYTRFRGFGLRLPARFFRNDPR